MRTGRHWARAACLLALCWGCTEKNAGVNVPTERAKRGRFVVSIRERCELRAENARKIICPFFRRWVNTKITKLVPEGTTVKKGDFLMSLDKTELKRMERDYKADLRRAKAEVQQLAKTLAIQKGKLAAEVARRSADLRLKELALSDLRALPGSVSAAKAEADWREAALDAAFASQEFEPIKRLAKLGIQSMAKFNEMMFAAKAAAMDSKAKRLAYDRVLAGAEPLELAFAALDLEEARVQYGEAQANLDLKVRQAELDLEAAQWSEKLQHMQLERFQESIKQADFYAPKAGVVVYMKVWQGNGLEKIKEGVAVRPRNHLMSLEDLSTMIAEVEIEEAVIASVKLKQKVKVVLDAVHGETFTGRVCEIGNIAREKGQKSQGRRWWAGKSGKEDSGIRVFDVKARLDGSDDRLRSGMAGNIEIFVGEVPDAISVPLTAVFRKIDGAKFVYVVDNRKPVERRIETGVSADGRVVVTKGLAANEVVCLAEPEANP